MTRSPHKHSPGLSECRKLTSAMRKGDEDAWREFHRRYFDFLRCYVSSRGTRPSDTGDVVQQIYLRIVRHIKPFEDFQNLEQWLRCVARCEIIDSGKKRHRRMALMERYQHWVENRHSQPLPQGESVEELLFGLSPDDQSLIRRYYVEGWSHRELAERCQSTPKAIESKLARIRKRIKDHQQTCPAT